MGVCSKDFSFRCEISFCVRFLSRWLHFKRSAGVFYDFLHPRSVNTSLLEVF